MGEELARPAHTTLNLVEDHQDTMLIAKITQTFETGVRQRADATFALHRLDHHRAGFVANRSSQGIMVGKI